MWQVKVSIFEILAGDALKGERYIIIIIPPCANPTGLFRKKKIEKYVVTTLIFNNVYYVLRVFLFIFGYLFLSKLGYYW